MREAKISDGQMKCFMIVYIQADSISNTNGRLWVFDWGFFCLFAGLFFFFNVRPGSVKTCTRTQCVQLSLQHSWGACLGFILIFYPIHSLCMTIMFFNQYIWDFSHSSHLNVRDKSQWLLGWSLILMGLYSLIAWSRRELHWRNLDPIYFQIYEILGMSRQHTQHLQGTHRYIPYTKTNGDTTQQGKNTAQSPCPILSILMTEKTASH